MFWAFCFGAKTIPHLLGLGEAKWTPKNQIVFKIFNDNLLGCNVIVLDEKQMDAGVALSGSSPAFVYELINDIADGAVTHGIPKEDEKVMFALQDKILEIVKISR